MRSGAGFVCVAMLSGVVTAAWAGGGPSPKPRPGLIVPQKSIDVLALQMSPQTVKARLGRPQRVERSSESETGRPIYDWIYTRRKLVATFRRIKGKRLALAGISTTNTRQRTRHGGRVGLTAGTLRARVPGLDCRSNGGSERWCTLGASLPLGHPQTAFVLRKGRVREVSILITWP